MVSYFTSGSGNLNTCEDSCTGGVFDLLKYLPTELFWQILKNSLLLDNLPTVCGTIENIEFWPKWSVKELEEVKNTNYIEPDVFISFTDFDVIIEAKRYDEKQQNPNQHYDQLTTYFNELNEKGSEYKKVYYVLLGGLHIADTTEEISVANHTVQLSKLKWSSLLDAVVSVKTSIEKQVLKHQKPMLLLLEDVITVLAIHGFHKKKWLSNMPTTTISQIFITNFKYKTNVK
jgi:hypothetical protein